MTFVALCCYRSTAIWWLYWCKIKI